MVDDGVGVWSGFVAGTDLPLHSTARCDGLVREYAHPCACYRVEFVARRKLHGEELEAASDGVQTRSSHHGVAVARAHVSVTIVVTNIGVLALEVGERVAFANSSVDWGHFVNTLERVDRATLVAELLVDRFEDAPSELARSWGQRKGSGQWVETCLSDRFVTASVYIFVLVGVRPDILRVLRENANDVLDLVFDLPCELKIVQTDVRAIQSRFFERHGADRYAERINLLTYDVATAAEHSATGERSTISPNDVGVCRACCVGSAFGGVVAISTGRSPVFKSYATRSIDRCARERTLVDGVADLVALTIDPFIFWKIFEIEVGGYDVLRDVVADKTAPLHEELFNIL